jgi:hypothetical protein
MKVFDPSAKIPESLIEAFINKSCAIRIEVYIDIYGYYAKIIFNKTYFNKSGFSKENY